ncbi:MAG: hypothetical protein HYX81_02370 [Chloroflexi bacterium]|nr:hypothetical protein [Chloroflexota bacterium]
MKLSKKGLFLLGMGAFVIITASLGAMRSQQVREHGQLNTKLSSTEVQLNAVRLEQLIAQQLTLEKQLAEATDELKKARTVFSQHTDSLRVTTTLFNVAEANGVQVTEAVSAGMSKETYDSIGFSVLPLTIKVEGDIVPLIAFVSQLNSQLPTGVIKAITINIPEASKGRPSASLQLALYTYQGG